MRGTHRSLVLNWPCDRSKGSVDETDNGRQRRSLCMYRLCEDVKRLRIHELRYPAGQGRRPAGVDLVKDEGVDTGTAGVYEREGPDLRAESSSSTIRWRKRRTAWKDGNLCR